MGERLTVDSVMTPDGGVMPLGPVDKEGRKVSLSTATLFADSGMECTVQRYEYLLGAGVWRASCDEGVVRVDEMHLIRPDTFGALMNDIDAAMDRPPHHRRADARIQRYLRGVQDLSRHLRQVVPGEGASQYLPSYPFSACG